MNIEFDMLANAAYIELSDREVSRTAEFSQTVMIDLDEFDMVVGIELLNPQESVDLAALQSVYHFQTDQVAGIGVALAQVRGINLTQNQLSRSTAIRATSPWVNNDRLELA